MTIYHYTSINAVFGIIHKDNLCFHATFFKKFKGEDYDIIQPDGFRIIEELCIQENCEFDPENDCYQPCIISFCEDKNSDYMWKNYAEYYCGVMLIVDKKIVDENALENWQTHGDCIRECHYIEEDIISSEIKKYLEENKELRPDTSNLQNDWTSMLGFLKTKKYNDECEYRYVRPYQIIATSEYCEGSTHKCVIEPHPEPSKDKYYEDVHFPRTALIGIKFGMNTTVKDIIKIKKHLERNGYVFKCDSDSEISIEG